MGTSPAIVYITEVAKPELRGALIATCPTLASLGKTVMLWQCTLHIDIFASVVPRDPALSAHNKAKST